MHPLVSRWNVRQWWMLWITNFLMMSHWTTSVGQTLLTWVYYHNTPFLVGVWLCACVVSMDNNVCRLHYFDGCWLFVGLGFIVFCRIHIRVTLCRSETCWTYSVSFCTHRLTRRNWMMTQTCCLQKVTLPPTLVCPSNLLWSDDNVYLCVVCFRCKSCWWGSTGRVRTYPLLG